jgi:hypothetical protein
VGLEAYPRKIGPAVSPPAGSVNNQRTREEFEMAEAKKFIPRFGSDADLARVGIKALNRPDTHLQCETCKQVWSPNLGVGGRLPRNWWKCENGCNHNCGGYGPAGSPLGRFRIKPGELFGGGDVKYYDFEGNWAKIESHLSNSKVQKVLVRDFNKFTFGRWGEKFKPGQRPCEFESCPWRDTAEEKLIEDGRIVIPPEVMALDPGEPPDTEGEWVPDPRQETDMGRRPGPDGTWLNYRPSPEEAAYNEREAAFVDAWSEAVYKQSPRYWDYVKHAACHWLVNFNLRLAELVEPEKKWRIVTSQAHSTVWDGKETLFDMNFSALGADADEAFRLASTRGKELAPGKLHRVHLAEDAWEEAGRKNPAVVA